MVPLNSHIHLNYIPRLPSAGDRLSWTFRLYQASPYNCVLFTRGQAGAALGAFVLKDDVDEAGFALDGVFFAFIHAVPAASAFVSQDVIGHESFADPGFTGFFADVLLEVRGVCLDGSQHFLCYLLPCLAEGLGFHHLTQVLHKVQIPAAPLFLRDVAQDKLKLGDAFVTEYTFPTGLALVCPYFF